MDKAPTDDKISELKVQKEKDRARFFAELRNDWAMPNIGERIHENAHRTSPSASIDLDICLVGSDRLELALNSIVRVTALDADAWRQQVEKVRPAFVVVEADWFQAGSAWRDRVIGADVERFFSEFSRVCSGMGIRTVFWFDQDRPHLGNFANVFQFFDFVFAHSLCAEDVRGLRRDAVPVPSYVDASCFNPYKHRAGDWSGLSELLPILMSRAFQYMRARNVSDLSERIENLFDQKLWLYEDRYSMRNNNQRMSPVERSRFLGCFSQERRASLLKTATAEILPVDMFPTESPQAERHILECLATKTIVISDSPVWRERLSDKYGWAAQSLGFKECIADIAANPIDAAAGAHLNWRHVMTKNTYFEFIEAICAALGMEVSYSSPKEARISFIMPTVRPDLIPMAIEFYQAQNYNNRELIIVLNTDELRRDALERMKGDDHSIRFFHAPSDMPVGCAVNLGVANMTGDYWAKMDDDDYYSPNYLSDINLYRKFMDFDIAGKAAVFNYLEGRDETILRSSKLWDRETHHFAGGTLVVKNAPGNKFWPEHVRGYNDIEFLTGRLVDGAHLASLDPFGHLQIRKTDSRFHTWTRQESQMAADFRTSGLNLESIFV